MKRLFSAILIISIIASFVSVSESAIFGKGKVYIREKGGTLHLRSAATTQSESLGIVHQGDEIDVLMLGDEWSYIYSYRESKNGYIKTKYIVDFVPAENMYTEVAVKQVTGSIVNYPMPGKYTLDLDGDGISDTVDVSMHYDEYGMEYFRLIFYTAYGSSGEATLPFSEYAARIAFAKLDDSNRVYTFVTGDEASTDFATYGFYVDEGHMKNITFYPPEPFKSGIGMAGQLSKIDDKFIHIEPMLDVLGTRFYTIPMIIENGALVPAGDGTYVSLYDLMDSEIWDYAALETKCALPCLISENTAVLKENTQIIITWLNVSDRKVGFITKAGENGYFEYQPASEEYWGVEIGGIHESDAFIEIPYAG